MAQVPTSDMGQQVTSPPIRAWSALPLKADMRGENGYIGFGPGPDMLTAYFVTVGCGACQLLAAGVPVYTEYNYLDFGTEPTFFTPTGALPGQPPFDEDIRQKIQVVKVGTNYKFDWGGPLAERY
ncbi:hypothetical protein [Bradyrhizobium jicamae]|uniref:hypothetical protein n=1 Tax=Bradyrhizobium jicamae TaxID=280332 RepID=UPI0012EDB9CD|nr:hypothetical protein [Bradyrhizobium jicamae]